MNAFDFLIAKEGQKSLRASELTGLYQQLSICTMILVIYLRNAWHSIGLVIKYPRKIAPWCSLIMALAGVISFGGFALPYYLPGGPSCRVMVYTMTITGIIIVMISSIILLERAYLAHCRNRYLLFTGIFLVLLEPLALYVLFQTGESTFSLEGECYLRFPYYVPVVNFLLIAPVNVVLSVAFLLVVYRKYRRYGGQCWKVLVREGIFIMLLILGSDFLCMICNVFSVLGSSSVVLYVIEK
jgi:hypothetical protein